MGITLQQALAQGATVVSPQQSASTSAYQAFVKANVPNSSVPSTSAKTQSPASPALKSFIATGAAPGATAPAQGVAANLPGGVKDALGDVFVKPEQQAMADAGTRIGQAAALTAEEFKNPGYSDTPNNIDTKLKQPVSTLGVTVQPQQTGVEGAKQIGNQALNAAGAIGNVALAGELATNIPKIPGLLNQAANKLSSVLPEVGTATEVPKPVDILASRTADATPDYNKKMVSDYIKTADTVDAQGNTIPGKTVPRVNEGEGLTGQRIVNTSKAETANGAELAQIKNYPDNGTALEKAQAVHNKISTAAEDKANPLPPDTAKQQVYRNVFDNMNGDARNAFIAGSHDVTGAAERANTIVGRYGQEVAEQMSKYDGISRSEESRVGEE